MLYHNNNPFFDPSPEGDGEPEYTASEAQYEELKAQEEEFLFNITIQMLMDDTCRATILPSGSGTDFVFTVRDPRTTQFVSEYAGAPNA